VEPAFDEVDLPTRRDVHVLTVVVASDRIRKIPAVAADEELDGRHLRLMTRSRTFDIGRTL
jgi:hypothetical protein